MIIRLHGLHLLRILALVTFRLTWCIPKQIIRTVMSAVTECRSNGDGPVRTRIKGRTKPTVGSKIRRGKFRLDLLRFYFISIIFIKRFYRPKGKVMFQKRLSFCPQVGRGVGWRKTETRDASL